MRFVLNWAFVFNGPVTVRSDPVSAQQPMALGVEKMGLQTPKKTYSYTHSANGTAMVSRHGHKAQSYKRSVKSTDVELNLRRGLHRSFVSLCGGPCPEAVTYYKNMRQGRCEAEVG